VADNLDFSVKTRVQTSKNKNLSIHWKHQYGIKDRVNCTLTSENSGQKKIEELELSQLLPTAEVNAQIGYDFVILVSRVLTKFLKPFEIFKDVVIHHIPHQYTDEMTAKSDVVSYFSQFSQFPYILIYINILTLQYLIHYFISQVLIKIYMYNIVCVNFEQLFI
jgi:hypothetical protein